MTTRFPRVAILVLSTLCAGCFRPDVPWPDMEGLYAAASRDAERAEPTEVVTDLPVIEPGKSELVWEAPGGRLLGTAWVERAGRFTEGQRVTLDEDLWIVPAPRVEDFCRDIHTGKTQLLLRLEQLFGLPPRSGRDRKMVRVWVEPFEVFRPCPDPETTDDHCDVHAPLGDDHRAWFAEQEAQGRNPQGGLWTRLGYTYDWGNPYTEVGLPELVVPAGTGVDVEQVTETKRFCRD